MAKISRNWEEIARELSREKNPHKRKTLERDLNSALEQAGFQRFSRRTPQTSDDQGQDKKTG